MDIFRESTLSRMLSGKGMEEFSFA